MFRLDDELVLCTGPKGRPFVTITERGMGAIGAQRPLVIWDDVRDFRVTAGLRRGRIVRGLGIARMMLSDGVDADQTPDDSIFPDRVQASWVFARRDEAKHAGFGYIPRWARTEDLDEALDVIRAIADAADADVRAAVIGRVPSR